MEQRIFSHPGSNSGGICHLHGVLHSHGSRVVIFALEEVVRGKRAPFRLSGLSQASDLFVVIHKLCSVDSRELAIGLLF